jgi:uncharacterized protein YyaL (SSP411 family)
LTNRLGGENSPYLLQHASNPVDWYPWGDEALAKARAADKPIFLSIGYAACHWCHVMEHESFEDPETAAILNQNFVSIKVDREQRPDLDAIYMQATTALTGSGGWPMSLFLTPDLRPFYAGTYFPPVRRYGMPAFKEVLRGVAEAWHHDREDVTGVATKVAGMLQASAQRQPGDAFTEQMLDQATAALLRSYDWENGGWGSAPKFPQPMAIEFLLRRSQIPGQSNELIRAGSHALRAMARGGMYDVVGGGFSRYSTDVAWHVPHFEKMLYDNAQLARTYLHAWQVTREPLFERIVSETLDFVLRELTDSIGGFYSSLDADSNGEEGAFYVWTKDEIRSALGEADQFELFAAAYGITERGNWESRTVLQRALDDVSLAARFALDPKEVAGNLAASHRILLETRSARARPTTDDKVLTSWNGLMLRTLAEAATALGETSRRQRYLEAATRNAAFLLQDVRPAGHLRHSWRKGHVGAEVFLEDYASLILGLLQLYQADFNVTWFSAARALADEMLASFPDSDAGFFDTPKDAQTPLVRPQDLQDNATPSGNAMAAEALLQMADLDGAARYRDAAETALRLVAAPASSYPTAFAHWLSAADRAFRGGQQAAIIYSVGVPPTALLDVVRRHYRPNLVLAASTYPPAPGSPALLEGRLMQAGKATAYVCRDFVCNLPVTAPEELKKQI